jgi:hypothetical protein
MRALLCLPLVLAAAAWADEAADRTSIERVIAAVNQVPAPDGIFTADSDAAEALKRVWKDKSVRYRFGPRSLSSPGAPTVVISHEPWGEATIGWPVPPTEMMNPRIVSRSIRFLTPDVALAEGACVYEAAGSTHTTPLLFVMKKEGETWKIASLRVLAQPQVSRQRLLPTR